MWDHPDECVSARQGMRLRRSWARLKYNAPSTFELRGAPSWHKRGTLALKKVYFPPEDGDPAG